MSVKIYNVGPDELFLENGSLFEWVVSWYEIGSSEGNGEAVSRDLEGVLRYHSLGHCSCFGTEAGMSYMSTILSVEDLTSPDIHENNLDHEEVRVKVLELLGVDIVIK